MLFFLNQFHQPNKCTDVLTAIQEIYLGIPTQAIEFAFEKAQNIEECRANLKQNMYIFNYVIQSSFFLSVKSELISDA